MNLGDLILCCGMVLIILSFLFFIMAIFVCILIERGIIDLYPGKWTYRIIEGFDLDKQECLIVQCKRIDRCLFSRWKKILDKDKCWYNYYNKGREKNITKEDAFLEAKFIGDNFLKKKETELRKWSVRRNRSAKTKVVYKHSEEKNK